jgi:chromate transporter
MNWKFLWDIFFLFARVAMFSWGGGPASMALMQRETTHTLWMPPGSIEAQAWVNSSEFADALAVGNALPGPIAPQVSAYIGYKLAGTPGAIAAASGTVIPTTVLMLIMVAFFFGVKDSPTVKAMLQAVRPLVVGLLLWTAYDMFVNIFNIKKMGWMAGLSGGWDKLLIVAASFVVLTFTNTNPVVLVICAALLGLLVYR